MSYAKSKGIILFELVIGLIVLSAISTLTFNQYVEHQIRVRMDNQIDRFNGIGEMLASIDVPGEPLSMADLVSKGFIMGCAEGSYCQQLNKTSWGSSISVGTENDWKTFYLNVPFDGLDEHEKAVLIGEANTKVVYPAVKRHSIHLSFVSNSLNG